jgi:hypothetical protein
MQQLGYLAFDPVHRGYHPTVRVAILGGWLNEALAPKGSVTNIMEELRRRTGETIILALQNGIYAQYASILLGTSPERIYIRIGALKPICRAAVGKALLAGKSRSEIALLVRLPRKTMLMWQLYWKISPIFVNAASPAPWARSGHCAMSSQPRYLCRRGSRLLPSALAARCNG